MNALTKTTVLGTLTLLLALSLSGCDSRNNKEADPGSTRTEGVANGSDAASVKPTPKKILYQCAMHPQIIRDKPGTCPICGMELVPIPEELTMPDSTSADGSRPASPIPVVRVDPTTLRNIGLRTEVVHSRLLTRDLRLNGKIAVDEARIYSVTARVEGYVETLAATSIGKSVQAGETLLELYSPDLLTAQQEYLQGGPSALGARERMLNWGVSTRFLARLEKTREIKRRVPLLAPAAGVITRKEVVQGQSVGAGMELFRITDLSEVWVTARVYPTDLPWVKTGGTAAIQVRNLPDRDFSATVLYVSPELDPTTRTAEIRMKLVNTPGRDLRPEMFAEVVIAGASEKESLTVPAQSLIRTGGRNVAVVTLGGGRFQPREVRIGRETGEWIEILDGLQEGEQIVVAAQFLIDSESNLRAAIASMSATQSGPSNQTDTPEAGHAR